VIPTITTKNKVLLNTAGNYLKAVKILFEANRSNKYPFITDLGIESGPLPQNIGHTLELLFKVYIFTHFEQNKNYRHMELLEGVNLKFLKNNMLLRKQVIEQMLKTHNLRYLLILCSTFGSQLFFKTLNENIRNWDYHREKYEIYLDPVKRPNISDFKRNVHNLNIRYSSPFDTRYPIKGLKHLANSEILIVAATTFYNELNSYSLES
jgi:hypothetical protein